MVRFLFGAHDFAGRMGNRKPKENLKGCLGQNKDGASFLSGSDTVNGKTSLLIALKQQNEKFTSKIKSKLLSSEVWTLMGGWGLSPRLLGLTWEENQLVPQGNLEKENSSDKWGPQHPPPLVSQELTVAVGNGTRHLGALPLFSMIFIFTYESISSHLLLTFNRDDENILISIEL